MRASHHDLDNPEEQHQWPHGTAIYPVVLQVHLLGEAHMKTTTKWVRGWVSQGCPTRLSNSVLDLTSDSAILKGGGSLVQGPGFLVVDL